ncbi:transcriptional regulator Crp family [Janthinobacterium sp. HH01]|uniref:Helix-turn-helix domain-containing protein n=2 Tax=Oxalobacteraceae TaxID=75682 RepID=A0A843SC92_9BURK|nr:transcriptional regulator Crp family [Janthinobacterium sp. HH01]MQA22145.1 helix-turn-helix domain-containing protein [Rugamonas rivuli]
MPNQHQISLKEALRTAIWAQGLTPEQMARVEAETFETFVAKGGYVCRKGEMVENWLGIMDGMVKMTNFSAAGKSVSFTGVPAGGWFGEGSLLKKEILKYDAMALRDTRIARMPISTFHWLLETSLPFTRFLLMQLNERLGQFIGMVENDRLLNPDTRVARCLVSMFNSHLYPGLEKLVQISQEELGLLSGASRQRANQALQLLEKQGLLSLDYGGIRILDLEGLRRYEA